MRRGTALMIAFTAALVAALCGLLADDLHGAGRDGQPGHLGLGHAVERIRIIHFARSYATRGSATA